MKHRIAFIDLLLLAVFIVLAFAPALASSTWYVDGVHGKNKNDCRTPQTACKTIGHAISLASSGDSIMVAAATYTENLTIGFSLKIIGSAATTTIVDGGGNGAVVTISNASAHVALSMVTIRNGHAEGGGGIINGGTLTISNSTIRNNEALGPGGGIYNSGGTLTIDSSSIAQNAAVGFCIVDHCHSSYGGGIDNAGTLAINNSTISGNSAVACAAPLCNSLGGGIYNVGTLAISNSTISGNLATTQGGGGGIYGSAILQNSIVANSPTGGNCNGSITSNGYNLSSDNTCNFNGPGDLNNTDPKLGRLGNNGGPTQTQALLSGSPAIDAGNPNGCTDGKGRLLKTDQRGMPRPDREDKSGCDMGAYEEQSQLSCIPLGDPCFGPGPLKCCPAFPRHTFCSSKTGWGRCLIDSLDPIKPL